MDAGHVVEYTPAVVEVAESLVEAVVAVSSAGVVDVDWSAVEALETQAGGLCHPVRVHPEVEALPVLLCKVGLSAVKGH